MGQFRFQDEDLIDEEFDNLGIRVFDEHEFWDFEDLEDVPFEPLFRQFKIRLPYELIKRFTSVTMPV